MIISIGRQACQERDVKAKELETLETSRLKDFSTGFAYIAAGVQEMYQVRVFFLVCTACSR